MANFINYRATGAFGGNREVFNKDEGTWYQKVKNGAKLSTTHCPAYEEFLQAGSFGYFNESTGVVSLLKVFTLAAEVTPTSTTVKIYQRPYDPVLKTGDVIMVAPATPSTTGIAITVGTLTSALVGTDAVVTFPITAEDLSDTVTYPVGTLFVIGASAGSGKLPAIPNVNVIFAETVQITKPLRTSDFQNGYADLTTSLYYHACIDRELVAIPDYVESLNKISNSALWFQL